MYELALQDGQMSNDKTHYSLIRSHSSRKKLKAIGEPITLLDTAPNTLAQSCFLIPELLETAHSKYLKFNCLSTVILLL